MTSNRLKALFFSLYFDQNKLIFMTVWLACLVVSWLFATPQEEFVTLVGQSFAYALLIVLLAFLLVIPVSFTVLIAGFTAFEGYQALVDKQTAQK